MTLSVAKRRVKSRYGTKSKLQKISIEAKSVGTIDLACKAENLVGKLFWLSLLMIGVAWVTYFVCLIIIDDNPIVTNVEYVPLENIDKPAITLCSKGATKFSVAERLGNFLDSDNIPEGIFSWKKSLRQCLLKNNLQISQKFLENSAANGRRSYLHSCSDDKGITSKDCQVSAYLKPFLGRFRSPWSCCLTHKICIMLKRGFMISVQSESDLFDSTHSTFSTPN